MATPRTILVGFDGSAAARRALDAAADLTGYGSRLTVVAVRSEADAAREHLLARQVVARYLEPAETLVDTAAEVGADLLVVARRAQSAEVVRGAPCDVLVVR